MEQQGPQDQLKTKTKIRLLKRQEQETNEMLKDTAAAAAAGSLSPSSHAASEENAPSDSASDWEKMPFANGSLDKDQKDTSHDKDQKDCLSSSSCSRSAILSPDEPAKKIMKKI